MKKVLIAGLLLPLIAHAEFFTGNELLRRMNSSDGYERTVAIGFVLGVHDTFDGDVICTGAGVTSGQLTDVVKQYLQNNPKTRDYTAATLTLVALGQAFPCKQNKGSGKVS